MLAVFQKMEKKAEVTIMEQEKEEDMAKEFYRCENCVRFHSKQCPQNGPVEATDNIAGCESFDPSNALVFRLYLSEEDQDRDSHVFFFTRAIDNGEAQYWVDLVPGQRHVSRIKTSRDWWQKPKTISRMAREIDEAGIANTEREVIRLNLRGIAKKIDEKDGLPSPDAKKPKKNEITLSPKEKKEVEGKLEDPDLLKHVKEELDRDHIGDDPEKLFVFCSAISGQLKPDYRFSTALVGYSSEGKDNLWKAVTRHLPEDWYVDVTRITGSSIEDDIKPFNTIYFGERGANEEITEQIKQLVEGGIDVIKKDTRTGYKTARRERQPTKVGIYSTTEDSVDEELATRYCIASVHGNPQKYQRVNEATLEQASSLKMQKEASARKSMATWIEKGLSLLKSFDYIVIPYAPLLKVESRVPRSQRDLKRFLNLIRALAWLHQRQRPKFEHHEAKILIATPEDLYNAREIGDEIFAQSLSGLEPRLQRVLEKYDEIVREQPNQITHFDDQSVEYLDWVDRSIIQKELGIKRAETIRRHIKTLTDMGMLTYYNTGNRSYVARKHISPTDSATDNLLIPTDKRTIYYLSDHYWDEILDKAVPEFDGASVGNRRSNRSQNRRQNTGLLSLQTGSPTDTSQKTHTDKESSDKKQFFSQLRQQSVAENPQVDKKQDLSQKEKVEGIKSTIVELGKDASHEPVIDMVSEKTGMEVDEITSIMDKLLEDGTLIPIEKPEEGTRAYTLGGPS